MVTKEIWMHALAYNLIRGLIAAAAGEHQKQPRNLSFKGALQALDSFREECGAARSGNWVRLIDVTPKVIASKAVGDRPNRIKSRAIKRRPKPHDLLKGPAIDGVQADTGEVVARRVEPASREFVTVLRILLATEGCDPLL
jgi:hypothetical protein